MAQGGSDEPLDSSDYVYRYMSIPGLILRDTDLKMFSKLGDRVGGAILEVIRGKGQVTGERLRRILTAVRASFEWSQDIEREADRVPLRTLALFEHLIREAGSLDDQKAILVARQEIVRLTGPQ